MTCQWSILIRIVNWYFLFNLLLCPIEHTLCTILEEGENTESVLGTPVLIFLE